MLNRIGSFFKNIIRDSLKESGLNENKKNFLNIDTQIELNCK